MISNRILRRAACGLAVAALGLATGCASGATSSRAPGPSPAAGSATPRSGSIPLLQLTWPVRTREHVDLWLHAYALLTQDTTLVPYFRRGYRDQLTTLRRQRGISTRVAPGSAATTSRGWSYTWL